MSKNPFPIDPFADIRDKRIGELNEEQTLRANELWLRNNLGWMNEHQRHHFYTLFKIIDGLRAKTLNWQPMSSAPTDGTKILAKLQGSDIPHAVFYQAGEWLISWDHHKLTKLDIPTHWAPIPDMPDGG